MKQIDARGLSCPEPVIVVGHAMKTEETEYQVIVDHPTARENVTRYARHQGYQVAVEEREGEYVLRITK